MFLDTNHWINLRHVVLQSPHQKAEYRDLLGTLESACAGGRVFCPLSASLMEELMKQTDPLTRRTTAQLMDRLSHGICLRYSSDLITDEIQKQIDRTMACRPSDLSDTMRWTKAGLWAGQPLPVYDRMLPDSREGCRRVWLDLQWAIGFEQVIQIPGFIPAVDRFAELFVDHFNSKVAQPKGPKTPLAVAVRKMRFAGLAAFRVGVIDALKRSKPKAEECDSVFEALHEAFMSGKDPWCIPPLQILAGMLAVAEVSGRKVVANDMIDIMHASIAVPYCDAFFCDKKIAPILRDSRLPLEKVYSTVIGWKPADISACLEKLTTC